MPIEDRGDTYLITHALARDIPSCLRDVEAMQVAFQKGLVKLGCICGYGTIDGTMEIGYATIQTPLTETIDERVKGFDNVVIINVLRTTTPPVGGLLKAFPRVEQGVISADHDEEAGVDDDGSFPITIDCMGLPEVVKKDTAIMADSMLTTGSAMYLVLDHILENTGVDPEKLFVPSTVSAPDGPLRVDNEFPEVNLLTVAIDDYPDDGGYIVSGSGGAGDRTFHTT